MEFVSFLNRAFISFESKLGRRSTITEFARHLGVPQTSLSTWINGTSVPAAKAIGILTEKLGPGVYQALDMPVPIINPRLKELKIRLETEPEMVAQLGKLARTADSWPNEYREMMYDVLAEMLILLSNSEKPRALLDEFYGAVMDVFKRLPLSTSPEQKPD